MGEIGNSLCFFRSELLIQNTSLEDNGTYHCEARNKAARAVSNFTLHVTSVIDAPEILKVKKEEKRRNIANG